MSNEVETKALLADSQEVIIRIGFRIHLARTLLKMSKIQLATAVNETVSNIEQYETGQKEVSVTLLAKISMILNVPVDHFFHPMSDSLDVASAPSFQKSAVVASIVDSTNGSIDIQEAKLLLGAYVKISDRSVRSRMLTLTQTLALGPHA